MKRLSAGIAAIIAGLVASFLFISPASRAAVAGAVSSAAESLGQRPRYGTYVNVDAGFGSAEIILLPDGRYTYGDDGNVSVEGTYQVSGKQIVFTEYGPSDALCLHLAGTYTWASEHRMLTLEKVSDPCSTREYDWGAGEWFKLR